MIFDKIIKEPGYGLLTRLALFIIHYNMEIDLDEIIHRFAGLHPRRMELANILSE